jgi:hypothetical protein
VSVLAEEDMSAGREVLVDKGSWAGVTCSWAWADASHTLAHFCTLFVLGRKFQTFDSLV